jgi:hypothetical protein
MRRDCPRWGPAAGATAQNGDERRRAIAVAVGFGGHGNLGSIVGAIMGARYGRGSLPRRCVAGLQGRELAEEAIEELLGTCAGRVSELRPADARRSDVLSSRGSSDTDASRCSQSGRSV